MRKSNIFRLLLTLIFIVQLIIPAFAEESVQETDSVPAPAEISIDAKAAVLIDADSGAVLYRQDDDVSCYPASTTKIMTCYLALKYGNPSDYYTVPEGVYEGLDASSSTVNLQYGETLTVYQLMQCLMISSANEAANTLACYISGNIDDFVTLMNDEALALGCANTHFVNPNGLHDEDHYTTALDLAIIAKAAMEYDTFREIVSTVEAVIPADDFYEERTLSNTNYLLPESSHSYYSYAQAIGIKTGFTTPAGYCLVAAAEQDGRTLISVVLGASAVTQSDGSSITGSFTESKKLLEWGFENYDTAIPYQAYLDTLPEEPEPEETVEPVESEPEASVLEEDSSIEETVEQENSAIEDDVGSSIETEPSPSPTPVVPSPIPSPEASEAPAETVGSRSVKTVIDSGTSWLETCLDEYSAKLAISSMTLLLIVIGIAAVLLILVLVSLFLQLKKRNRRNRAAKRKDE